MQIRSRVVAYRLNWNYCTVILRVISLSLHPLIRWNSSRIVNSTTFNRLIEKVFDGRRSDDDTIKCARRRLRKFLALRVITITTPRNKTWKNVDLLARASISIDPNRFSVLFPPSLFYCNLSYCGKLISSSCPPPPAHPFPSKRNRRKLWSAVLRDP